MNIRFLRCTALLLIPCLLTDPIAAATASGFSNTFLPLTPTTHISQRDPFSEQAIVAILAVALFYPHTFHPHITPAIQTALGHAGVAGSLLAGSWIMGIFDSKNEEIEPPPPPQDPLTAELNKFKQEGSGVAGALIKGLSDAVKYYQDPQKADPKSIKDLKDAVVPLYVDEIIIPVIVPSGDPTLNAARTLLFETIDSTLNDREMPESRLNELTVMRHQDEQLENLAGYLATADDLYRISRATKDPSEKATMKSESKILRQAALDAHVFTSVFKPHPTLTGYQMDNVNNARKRLAELIQSLIYGTPLPPASPYEKPRLTPGNRPIAGRFVEKSKPVAVVREPVDSTPTFYRKWLLPNALIVSGLLAIALGWWYIRQPHRPIPPPIVPSAAVQPAPPAPVQPFVPVPSIPEPTALGPNMPGTPVTRVRIPTPPQIPAPKPVEAEKPAAAVVPTDLPDFHNSLFDKDVQPTGGLIQQKGKSTYTFSYSDADYVVVNIIHPAQKSPDAFFSYKTDSGEAGGISYTVNRRVSSPTNTFRDFDLSRKNGRNGTFTISLPATAKDVTVQFQVYKIKTAPTPEPGPSENAPRATLSAA